MIWLAILFLLFALFIGSYRAKEIAIAQISPVHSAPAWMGLWHPVQIISWLLVTGFSVFSWYFFVVAIKMPIVWSLILSIPFLFLRWFISAKIAGRMVLKHHKKAAEYFVKKETFRDQIFKD